VRLEHLSEKAATFISRALEASSSIDSRLLLSFKTVRRRSVECPLVCVRALESLYYLSFVDFIVNDSILLYG
jgi:hypothetical protein